MSYNLSWIRLYLLVLTRFMSIVRRFTPSHPTRAIIAFKNQFFHPFDDFSPEHRTPFHDGCISRTASKYAKGPDFVGRLTGD